MEIMRLKSLIRLLVTLGLAVVNASCAKVDSLAQSVELPSFQMMTSSLFPAVVGQAYFYQIGLSGGVAPYTVTIVSGSLPSGLSMNSTGEIQGAPASGSAGTYNFGVQAVDGKLATVTRNFTLIVSLALNISTSSFPPALSGQWYTQVVSASGGSGVYTWSATGLPVGISIAPTTGVVSGNPVLNGSYAPTITVTDSNGLTNSKVIALNVTSPPSISTITLPAAEAGKPYNQALVATSGQSPYSFSISSGQLPQGLALSSAGVISGTAAFGSNVKNSPFNLTFQVTDALGQVATRSLALVVSAAPLILKDTEQSLRPGLVGIPYSDQLPFVGGRGTRTITATGLPPGVSLNAASGRLSGSPTTPGTYNVDFQIIDQNSLISNRTKKMTIRSAGLNGESEGGYMTTVGQYNGGWAQPFMLTHADMNGDGFRDIVYAGWDCQCVIVMLGNGAGVFTKNVHVATGRVWAVGVDDMDGDGHLDIVASLQTSNLNIFKGDSNWTNPPAITRQTVAVANDPLSFAIGDVNGDGKKDLLVTRWNGGVVGLYLNCGLGVTVPYNGNPTAACGVTGQTVINLHNPANPAAVSGPRGVALADMNGDGQLDLIYGSYNSSFVGISLGNGDGTFQAANTTAVSNPRQIRIADMNGDGKLDIISSMNAGVAVMLGNGFGGTTGIQSGIITDVGGTPEFLDVADVNGDGFPDIALAMQASHYNQIALFMNDGSGFPTNRQLGSTAYQAMGIALAPFLTGSTRPDLVFSAGQWVNISRVVLIRNNNQSSGFFLPKSYKSVPPDGNANVFGSPVAGDVNNDGYVDVVAKLGGAAALLLGGAGGLSLSNASIPTGETSANWWFGQQTLLSDVNLDGNLDFATANFNANGAGTVTVTLGNGDGTFGSQTSFTVNQSGCNLNLGARSMDFGDINRDGLPDLIIATGCANSPGSQVYIYYGFGDGTFNQMGPTILSGSGSYADFVKAEDIDGDGNLDVVIANNNAILQIYKGNGNGSFNLPAASVSLGISANIAQLALADFNNDGNIDVGACSVSGANIAVALTTNVASISSVSSIAGNVFSNDYISNICTGLVAADWNQDGRIDLMHRKTAANGIVGGGGGIHVYYGVGNGSFTVKGAPLSAANPGPYDEGLMCTTDLNGDGMLDLLTASPSNSYNTGSIINRSQ